MYLLSVEIDRVNDTAVTRNVEQLQETVPRARTPQCHFHSPRRSGCAY